MVDLANMRALLEKANAKDDSNTSTYVKGPSVTYPHWDIPVDSRAIVRFLLDNDETNQYFWRSISTRKLPFTKILGGTIKSKDGAFSVTVPAFNFTQKEPLSVPESHIFTNKEDPIQQLTSSWWNDGKQEQYRIYKRKVNHVYQGFVRVNPITDDVTPENPIRRFTLNKELHQKVVDMLMNPKAKHIPTDMENGRDFEIVRTMNGSYSDFGSSSFSFDEDALSEVELNAINTHGLYTLSDYIPKKPTSEELEMISEMFEASLADRPFEVRRWGAHFKPWGVEFDATITSQVVTPQAEAEQIKAAPSLATSDLLAKLKGEHGTTETVAPVITPVVDEAPAPVVAKSTQNAQDILAILKQKKQSQG